MKKKILSLVMVVAMFFAISTTSMAGTKDCTFSTKNPITVDSTRMGSGTRNGKIGAQSITNSGVIEVTMTGDGFTIMSRSFNTSTWYRKPYTLSSTTNVTVTAKRTSNSSCSATIIWDYNC